MSNGYLTSMRRGGKLGTVQHACNEVGYVVRLFKEGKLVSYRWHASLISSHESVRSFVLRS